MHHHGEHRTQSWYVWRNLSYLWTAVIALIVYRTTPLGMVGSIIVGFGIAAALVLAGYLVTQRHNRRNTDGD